MGRDFPHPSRPALGSTPASCTMDTGSILGLKRPGHDIDHPPPSITEVKEKVELYLYSPLGLCGLFWCELYLYIIYTHPKSYLHYRNIIVIVSTRRMSVFSCQVWQQKLSGKLFSSRIFSKSILFCFVYGT